MNKFSVKSPFTLICSPTAIVQKRIPIILTARPLTITTPLAATPLIVVMTFQLLRQPTIMVTAMTAPPLPSP